MKRLFMLLVIAATTLQPAFASSFDNMVIVRSDQALKDAGMTREQYNKSNPAAEKEWRKAWAAEGQKWDDKRLATIRELTSKPKGGQ